jgi:PD-(D/E)XK nuclease superfamily
LPVDPTKGATGYLQVSNRRHENDDVDDDIILNNGNDAPKETFLVRGIIDRLDMIHAPSVTASSTTSSSNNDSSSRRRRDSSVVLRLVDYKTGKAPHLKYSHAMNMKIIHEAFYQLKIYALLWRQQQQLQLQQQQATLCSTSDPYGDASLNSTLLSTTPVDTGIDLRFLRLFFLTSTPKDLPNVHEHNSAGGSSGCSNMGPAKFLDMDLGETPEQRDHVLQQVHVDLSRIWNEIVELVSLQDAKAWKGCTRSFCYCHTCRARFVPGTVWEPSPTTPPKAKSSSS